MGLADIGHVELERDVEPVETGARLAEQREPAFGGFRHLHIERRDIERVEGPVDRVDEVMAHVGE